MHTYNQAVGEIYRLGMCEGFTPALNDIVWFETEIRTHQISLEDLTWLESKFPKTSRMRRKLENWRQYVEGLEQANSRRVIAERLKQEAGRLNISRQTPRIVRDFCNKNEITKTGNQ